MECKIRQILVRTIVRTAAAAKPMQAANMSQTHSVVVVALTRVAIASFSAQLTAREKSRIREVYSHGRYWDGYMKLCALS